MCDPNVIIKVINEQTELIGKGLVIVMAYIAITTIILLYHIIFQTRN